MENRRDWSDFFKPPRLTPWGKFPEKALEKRNLYRRHDIRLHERDGVLVWAIRRSPTSPGYSGLGNFSISIDALEYLVHHQKNGNITKAYVMLLNDEQTDYLVVDTAFNVAREFTRFAPNIGKEGSEYWWSDEKLKPILTSGLRAKMIHNEDPPDDWLGAVPEHQRGFGRRDGNGNGNRNRGYDPVGEEDVPWEETVPPRPYRR